jgi:hypothetical protein
VYDSGVVPLVPRKRKKLLHLVARMVQRRVSWPQIVAVVGKPDKVAPGYGGAIHFYRVVGRRRLRVTVDRHGCVATVALAQRTK